MAEARTIETDDAITLGGYIDQAAGFEILDHAAIAVQQDQRRPRAAFDIVKMDAVYFQKLTSRRIVVFGGLGEAAIHQDGYGDNSRSYGCRQCVRMRVCDRSAFRGKGAARLWLNADCSHGVHSIVACTNFRTAQEMLQRTKTINIDVRSIGNSPAIRGGMKRRRRDRAFRHQTVFQGPAHCKRVRRAQLAAGGGSEIAARCATGLTHRGRLDRFVEKPVVDLPTSNGRISNSMPGPMSSALWTCPQGDGIHASDAHRDRRTGGAPDIAAVA
jgi:hypothetical protein